MRPSLSLAGAMVLSVVVEGVIKHMALDGNQLDTRSLEACPLPKLTPLSTYLHLFVTCTFAFVSACQLLLAGR